MNGFGLLSDVRHAGPLLQVSEVSESESDYPVALWGIRQLRKWRSCAVVPTSSAVAGLVSVCCVLVGILEVGVSY